MISPIIQFAFRDESKEVKQFVNEELERISPYLRIIIKAYYDLNWTIEYNDDEYFPDVQFTIPFSRGMPTGGSHGRVFQFDFYTDSSNVFELSVNEWIRDDKEKRVAEVELRFSDWLEVQS